MLRFQWSNESKGKIEKKCWDFNGAMKVREKLKINIPDFNGAMKVKEKLKKNVLISTEQWK